MTSQLMMAVLAALLVTMYAVPSAMAQRDTQSLAGEWRFLFDGPKPDDDQSALPALSFNATIQLPGTTETRRKGPEHEAGWDGQLTRLYKFEGAAWYQTDFTVPETWREKRVALYLERTKYAQVWLDGQPVGINPIICSPHVYDLGAIAPGRHTLTIVVDNSRRPVPGDNHQLSDNTQGNWNGIIGRMELRATDPVWIENVQVYPNGAQRSAKVRIALGNASEKDGRGTVSLKVNGPGVEGAARDVNVTWAADGGQAEVELPLGASAALWDEFHPNLHELTITLAGESIADERQIRFGLRDFGTRRVGDQGAHFTINGRDTFLRGKHDACVFPLTGHPPMDVEGWKDYFRVCQEHGLNHVRFHSWTPPEAAFIAADEMGIYLQPELPFWGDFNEEIKAGLKPEAERIMRHFGNHPSFVMFSMGNENRGSREVLGSLVNELRELDPRHLYAQGSNAFMWDPILPESDDFLVSAKVKNAPDAPSRHARGSHADLDHADGHIQFGPANTMHDYSETVAGMDGPVVGHEVGQWSIYPNFKEIEKYTGVTRAYNFEHFREKLEQAGMLDQADAFFRASGALSAMLYREDIETALRTPGFGGFQLLDLQDFPGQGTALVGVVDAFMDSKGVIAPDKWREFCSPIVLLARFEKYTWTTAETFSADIQVAHYGQDDLPQAVLAWRLREPDGETIASGHLQPTDIEQGGVRSLGSLATNLNTIDTATRLVLELELQGTDIHTSYDLWVYPADVHVAAPESVTVTRSVDEATLSTLSGGGRVLLIPEGNYPLVNTVGGGFATDFWNWPMFHNKPGTMGLLIDPQHPALAGFPTEFHSNWQWFHLARDSQPLILDQLPDQQSLIVQTIDNFERVHRLGLIFELKVGPGKLLVCATDLHALQDRPEARQLYASLLRYAGSDQFNPTTEMTPPALKNLFAAGLPMTGEATASTFERSWQNFSPARAADGNDHTVWRTGGGRRRGGGGNFGEQTAAPGAGGASAETQAPSHWWQFTFDAPQRIGGLRILFDGNDANLPYVVETSSDGAQWTMLSDQRQNSFDSTSHAIDASADDVKAVRITIEGSTDRRQVGLREVRVLRPAARTAK